MMAGDVVLAPMDSVEGRATFPPESDFSVVCERLTACGIQWEHADPEYSELQS